MANTSMLGALVRIRPIVDFDTMADHVINKLGAKLSQKVIEKNLSALKRAYEEVQ